jgi:dTDP-4-dehydrorhamnose reductase
MTVLILGASGLLGNAVFRVLSENGDRAVFGTIRNPRYREFLSPELAQQLITVDDLEGQAELAELFERTQPSVVINCISVAKPFPAEPMRLVSALAALPRRLQHRCRANRARLIQIGSDGVFSGKRGNYRETDLPDATDWYGVSKLLGEVEGPGCLTLRTSFVGHELDSTSGLLEWFLSQQDVCSGHRKSIFSGLTTVALAKVIRDVILPCRELEGILHLGSRPISKFELLRLFGKTYGRPTRVIPQDTPVLDRSLNCDWFARRTGYVAPDWPELVAEMFSYRFGLRNEPCLTTR